MADNSIGNNEIIDGSITGGKLASLAISTAQIAATAVNESKIANDAVTTDKIADNAVDTAQIANDAVEPTKISQTNQAGYGFTPTGTVIWYAGSTAPTGYLKANGDQIPNGSGTVQGVSSDFSGLYAIVGANLPDLRGEFIRAWDDGKGTDSGRAIRTTQDDIAKTHNHTATAANDGAHEHNDGGNNFNTSAGTAHRHTVRSTTNSGGTWTSGSNNYGWLKAWNTGSSGTPDQNEKVYDTSLDTESAHTHPFSVPSSGPHSHNISVQNQSGGGTETRPRNVALLACIKY